MPVPRTASMPSWARGLAGFEAETGQDFGGQSPEEAYGFAPSGTTGRPGMIRGTTRQMDMTATRAFRNRTSPGGAYPSSATIDTRLQAQHDQGQMQRASMWNQFVRSNRPPMHGEMRQGADGKMWRYNAATGRGEPVGAAGAGGVMKGVNRGLATTGGVNAAAKAALSTSSAPPVTTPLSGSTAPQVSAKPAHTIDGQPAAFWIGKRGGTIPQSTLSRLGPDPVAVATTAMPKPATVGTAAPKRPAWAGVPMANAPATPPTRGRGTIDQSMYFPKAIASKLTDRVTGAGVVSPRIAKNR